jgi:NAD(P)-dependent dehydrogenase (short-subunit alcohol dehydrogenase family)
VLPRARRHRTATDSGRQGDRGARGRARRVVNNAGAFEYAPLDELTLEGFRDQIDVNLTGAFAVTKAFLPAMRARESGHLFYMGSVASIMAYPGNAGYCTASTTAW